jgi:molecular chaperone GrpE (heat shock protein)
MNEPTGGKSTTTFNNVELWRERAKEMRLLAERVDEGPTRERFLQIAAEFDHLAERAEQRNASAKRTDSDK